MKDPTTMWLDAALLDQVVAGKFHGRPYAFVPIYRSPDVFSRNIWGIGIAVEGEHGHYPVAHPSFTWAARDEAAAFCEGMNRHVGLSPLREVEIVASSMRKPNRLRITVEDAP